MEYLLLLLIFAIIPAAFFLSAASKLTSWKALFFTTAIIATIGLIADYFGITRNIWMFTLGAGKTVGIQIFNIPIEDYIFALTAPLLIVGCYNFIRKFIEKAGGK